MGFSCHESSSPTTLIKMAKKSLTRVVPTASTRVRCQRDQTGRSWSTSAKDYRKSEALTIYEIIHTSYYYGRYGVCLSFTVCYDSSLSEVCRQ
jgi:hypothetical protein